MDDSQTTGQRILLVDLDTNEIWAIDTPDSGPPEGGLARAYSTPLALTETTLLAAHAPKGKPTDPAQYFYEIIEYDLAKVSSFAKKLP